MARKTVYSRDDIVGAALEVVDEHGIAGLTARRVADRLGSSTAPVYSNFASMDELQKAVVRRAKDVLISYAGDRYTDDEFLDMGVGVTEFARDHGNLYRVLFLDQLPDYDPSNDVFDALLDRMGAHAELGEMPVRVREDLLDVMATFTHGVATAICTGLSDGTGRKETIAFLREVGAVFLEAARERAAAGTSLFPEMIREDFCRPRMVRGEAEEDHDE